MLITSSVIESWTVSSFASVLGWILPCSRPFMNMHIPSKPLYEYAYTLSLELFFFQVFSILLFKETLLGEISVVFLLAARILPSPTLAWLYLLAWQPQESDWSNNLIFSLPSNNGLLREGKNHSFLSKHCTQSLIQCLWHRKHCLLN